MPVSIVIAILLCGFDALAQAPKSEGKYTKDYTEPRTAHINNFSDAGKVRRIRGALYCCKEGIPLGAIISLYKLTNGKEQFVYSYLVGSTGKFFFKRLKEGVYFLKTGTIDGYFNSETVKVLLAPKDKDSSIKDLEIHLEVGT
jgi:hypothetical protein